MFISFHVFSTVFHALAAFGPPDEDLRTAREQVHLGIFHHQAGARESGRLPTATRPRGDLRRPLKSIRNPLEIHLKTTENH